MTNPETVTFLREELARERAHTQKLAERLRRRRDDKMREVSHSPEWLAGHTSAIEMVLKRDLA